jgi:hypothetical protein
MINRKVSAPSNNLTMKPEPRLSIYTGFRTAPIMRGGNPATVEAFEQAVAAIPHVRQAQRLFGEPGYLLRVITADLPAFPGGLGQPPRHPPGVQRLSSTLVMKSVVENRPLPLYQNRRHQRGPACGTGDRATASRTVAFEEHAAVHAANEASTRYSNLNSRLPTQQSIQSRPSVSAAAQARALPVEAAGRSAHAAGFEPATAIGRDCRRSPAPSQCMIRW